MTPEDAHPMLADLQEEAARLHDPAAWQFVGGDPAVDAATADALAAQLDGVPALRRLAPALAEDAGRTVADVLDLIGDYEQATRAALERTQSGRAPEQPRRVQVASTDAPPDASADAPSGAPAGHARGAAAGMGTAEPPHPSLRSAAVVAAVVLVAVVVVVVLVLVIRDQPPGR